MSPAAPSQPAAEKPIGAAEFAALMQSLLPAIPATGALSHIAVAVSGGADSMALMHLLAPWCREHNIRLSVLSVDHGLRPEAADETAFVMAVAHRLGLPAETLSIKIEPGTNLQARARDARYAALDEWCRANSVEALALAHHRDDQAETVLMRLARGSDVWGLAGMKPVSEGLSPKAPFRVRPLLSTPKSRLIATLRALGENWIEDPSNENPAFERVRIRQNWPAFESLGLDADRLAETARRLGAAREALQADVDALLRDACVIDPGGFARLSAPALLAAPDAVAA
ncbi:MAG: tRNA lysidine(34) synthetase TilS, partial [Alphaproteobacteria bacterium]|nr:tRNA lysidine(34) synthetase TilS [Alphaproteobacteria bacterium]